MEQNNRKNFTPSLLDRVDIKNSGWISAYAREFIIIHNPAFLEELVHPYVMDTLLAIYCEKGEISGKLNLNKFTITPGGFLIVLPGNVIESLSISSDFSGTYFFMSEDFLNSLNLDDHFGSFETVAECPYIIFDEAGKETFGYYINLSRKMLSAKQNPDRAEVISLLTKSFFLGMGYFTENKKEGIDTTDGRMALTDKFMALIKEHYIEHRDVDFYAKKMNMTPKYMSTVIKNISGKSASKWIDEYVVLTAKAQLSNNRKNIKTICKEMGFTSLSFFGRYFKRVTGMSPREYRYSILKTIVPGDGDID